MAGWFWSSPGAPDVKGVMRITAAMEGELQDNRKGRLKEVKCISDICDPSRRLLLPLFLRQFLSHWLRVIELSAMHLALGQDMNIEWWTRVHSRPENAYFLWDKTQFYRSERKGEGGSQIPRTLTSDPEWSSTTPPKGCNSVWFTGLIRCQALGTQSQVQKIVLAVTASLDYGISFQYWVTLLEFSMRVDQGLFSTTLPHNSLHPVERLPGHFPTEQSKCLQYSKLNICIKVVNMCLQ